MRKIAQFFLLVLAIAAFAGCNGESGVFHNQSGIIGQFLPKDDESVSADYFEQVASACHVKDAKALTDLFSANTIAEVDDFSGAVQELFTFWDGKLISYDQWGGPSSNAHFNDPDTGGSWEILYGTFDVETESGILRFAMEVCTMDTTDADNLGIHSLYVISGEDSDLEFAYWGDGEWNPGITIEIP